MKKFNLNNYEFIIIDGYVFLDDLGKKGLGAFLFDELGKKTPIIGIAKSNFLSITQNKKALIRGDSKKPLYITAIGVSLDIAFEKVKKMHGNYRIPTLLKKLDRLTKRIDLQLTSDLTKLISK